MKTLNEIKILLKAWFNNHALINSVYYCDDWDFNSERSINYPVVNLEYLNSNINNTTINHNYKVVIADVVEANNTEMEDNIHSDSLQVAEDFYTYLQNLEGITFNRVSTINKFTDDTGDRASGIIFTITIAVIRPQNRCSAPTSN
jgi:hypothetical protein